MRTRVGDGSGTTPKMIFVNLPVADVNRSIAFYRRLGVEQNLGFGRPIQAAMMAWSDTIAFMPLSRITSRALMAGGAQTKRAFDAMATMSRIDVAAIDAALAAG